MTTVLLENVLYSSDMIKIESGEILSVCGNFEGPWCRARLSFYPHNKSRRFIKGSPYTKASYETGYILSNCEKALDLPGEQHFLVHQSQIKTIFRASEAFGGLSSKNSKQCKLLIDLFHEECHLKRVQHGLTGSGALHNIQATSDFDWIVYNRDPAAIETYVTSNNRFRRELTFDMSHVYKKYRVFTGLSRMDIDRLFQDRWKYFQFQDMRISMSFVDPLMRADDFIELTKTRKRITMKGTITDAIGCYHMPRVIPLICDNNHYLLLTWLFLYNGAFKAGDVVEFSGTECSINDNTYVLVETPQDYIKKLPNKKGSRQHLC